MDLFGLDYDDEDFEDRPVPRSATKAHFASMEEAVAYAAQVRDEHLAALTPDAIDARVQKEIDRQFEDLLAKLFGMNNRWDYWEVDHCNGRAGESFLGDGIRILIKQRSEAFLAAALDGFTLEPNEEQVAAIRQELMEEIGRNLDRMIENTAEGLARALAQKVLPEVYS